MINLKRYIIFLLVLCSAIGYAQSFSSPTKIPANGNVTVNGVTITTASTGDANNSISANPKTPCLPSVTSPELTTVPGQLRVGSSDGVPSASTAWSVTLNFSSPVNNVVFSITAVDGAENFIFNSNGGPVSLSYNSCYMNVTGNQAVTNGVIGSNVSDVTGGFFQANSPFPYTQLTINGNGGGFGSVILLSGGSVGYSGTIDSDGDSIADESDLDDDNDGILDTDEQTCLTPIVIGVDPNSTASESYGGTTATYTEVAGSVEPYTFGGYTGFDPSGYPSKLQIDYSKNLTNYAFRIADLDILEKVRVSVYDKNGALVPNILPFVTYQGADVLASAQSGMSVLVESNTNASGSGNSFNANIYIDFKLPFEVSRIDFDFYDRAGGSPEYYFLSGCVVKDTDGDIIPDYLDLDSDGDGCPDAVEGGDNITKAMLNGSNAIGTNISGTLNSPAIATVDANGVPVITNTGSTFNVDGQAQGQTAGSAYTSNPAAVAGTASSNQTISWNTVPSAITLTGNTGTIQWQSSADNVTFTNISGATSASYSPGTLTSTTYYRAIISSVGGCTATSDVLTITVNNGIDAVNDTYASVTAGTSTTSVIANDKNIAGTAAVIGTGAGQVSISTSTNATGTSGAWPTGFTLNADGTITVAAGTAAGTYTLYYTICNQTAGTPCDTAAVTLTVIPTVQADDDAFAATATQGISGATLGNVLTNDNYNGGADGSATTSNVNISVTTPATPAYAGAPVPSINTATGAVTLPPNTPAGSYTITYQICDKSGSPCDPATVTVTVAAPTIDAVNGTQSVSSGTTGTTSVLANDTYNGGAAGSATLANVNLTQTATTNPGVTLNTTTGMITVAAGMPAGTYVVTYQICDKVNTGVCDTATETVTVPNLLDAVNDNYGSVTPGSSTTSVIANDKNIAGTAAVIGTGAGQVSISTSTNATGTSGAWPTGFTLNADGTITVAAGTAAGTYTLYYTICNQTAGTPCDTAAVTLTVIPTVQADDDAFVATATQGISGATLGNVLTNDNYNGGADGSATTSNVNISVTTPATPAYGGAPVPSINTATGAVTLPPNTPAGSYTITYQICDKSGSPCDPATVTVTVAAPTIDAVNGTQSVSSGTTGTTSVLANDTYNGGAAGSATLANVNLTQTATTNPGVTLNTTTGMITVAAGTPAGTYVVTYEICDKTNPGVCDTATETVTVPNLLDAVNDNYGSVTPGSSTTSVIANDKNIAGTAAVIGTGAGQVSISTSTNATGTSGAWPTGFTLNADGTITVAAGTAAGTYTLYYTICNQTAGTPCDTAAVTLTVIPTVQADDDAFAATATQGISGATLGNVLTNDNYNGGADGSATTSNVNISVTTPATPAYGGAPVPSINTATGAVTLPPNTPAGSYTITYQICDKSGSPCDPATVTVTVAAPTIDAVNGTQSVSSGTTGTTSVLANDTYNGGAAGSATLANVNLTQTATTNAGVTLNTTTGMITVAAGTPAGSYVVTYQICDKVNTGVCDTATETVNVAAPAIDAVTETTPAINGINGGTTASLLANDTLNGAPVTVGATGNVTLTPVTVPAGLTMNADGTVTVAAGTPAGNYNVTYQICDKVNPTNCDTVTSIVVVSAPAIDAVNGTQAVSAGTKGTTSVLANDTYNGGAAGSATLANVHLTQTATTNAGVTLNTTTGMITVAAGTPAGSYVVTYQICDKVNTGVCDTATETVNVAAPAIDAVTETTPAINGINGGTTASLLANDTLNGAPVTVGATGNVTLTPVTVPAGLTMNADGTVTVAAGTPAGNYNVTYQICDKVNPTNCDTVTSIVVVSAPAIDAVNGTQAVSAGTKGTTSVLANDTYNGGAAGSATLANVHLTQTATTNAGVTLNTTTGMITVAAGTPAGSYVVTYQICDKVNTGVCDTATETVNVAAPAIDAVTETTPAINGINGGTTASLLANDTLNGAPVTVGATGNVTLTPVTVPAGLTMNADGTVTVAAGTPAGNYNVTYQICDKVNPTNCDTVTSIVVVSAPAIDAVNGTQAVSAGTTGTTSVLANDTYNGGAAGSATLANVHLTQTATTNAGVTLNTTTGMITVAAGTPAGSYVVTYQICDKVNTGVCDTATETVNVAAPAIDAVTETTPAINGINGGTTASLLANDTLNGAPVTVGATGNVTLTPVTVPAGLTMNADGTVTVAAGTPAGNYNVTYQICDKVNPTNCDTVTSIVVVSAPAIDAVNGTQAVSAGTTGTTSVLANDTYNGGAAGSATLANVHLTQTATTNAGVTLNTTTGMITVAAGTPAGSYVVTYQICDKVNTGVCDTATETVNVAAPAIDAVTETTPAINGINGGTTASLLANDTLNGAPVTVGATGNVTLTPVTVPAGLTMNADGTVTVAAGTPAGNYNVTYQICDKVNPTNCDTVTSIVVVSAPAIDAVNGTQAVSAGTTGTTSVLANDTYNGGAAGSATLANVHLTQTATTNAGVTLNTTTGMITVAAGTPAGSYVVTYQICDKVNTGVCDTATETVNVAAPAIDAVTETTPAINGINGGTTASLLANDTLNGAPVTVGATGNVTLTPVTVPAGLTMNADGTVTVAAGTPAGNYNVTYQICDKVNPTNCDTVTSIVVVSAPAIDAVNGTQAVSAGTTGTTSVLANDTYNGGAAGSATLANVHLTQTATTNAGVTLNTTTGMITVAAGTPAGSYVVTYQICDKVNTGVCDTATETVNVAAPAIDAVTETTPAINGINGGTTASLLANDTLNGAPVTVGATGNVTLTPVTVPAGLTMNADGTVTVAAGTPAGNYNVTYQICDKVNPTNCDTVTSIVVVSAPAIDAVNGTQAVSAGTTGTTSVLANDTYNGGAAGSATLANVNLTQTATTNAGVTLNTTTGMITVAAGTPAGSYVVTYQICDKVNTGVCDTATETVNVAAPAIDAVTETTPAINGINGGTTASLLANDTLNGAPVTVGATGNVTLTPVTVPAGLTMNADGTVTVAAGTPAGNYNVTYQICDKVNPTNCDTVTSIVVVSAPAIDAVNDTPTPVNGTPGGSTPSVLANDTLNGSPLNPADVTLTPTSVPAGLTLNPDGTVTVAPNTPAGTYPVVYTICEIAVPTNCDTATANVVVTTIDAVNDTPVTIPSATGGTTPSVLANVTLNGLPLNPADVTLIPTSVPAGLTLNPDGTITVAPGTPNGTYPVVYQICQVANPAVCDTATATVVISAIDAVNDNPLTISSGGNTPSVLVNYTLNGLPVVPSDITLTPVSVPVGLTLNPDGTITVAPNVPSGSYPVIYTICEIAVPTNCDSTSATVVVGNPIDAVNDNTYPVQTPSTTVATPVGNVTLNDTLNGVPVTASNTDVTPITTGPLSIDADGVLTLAPNTTSGTYTITYQLCEVGAVPTNCDTAIATVVVGNPIVANDDLVGPIVSSTTATTNVVNVLANDTFNGNPLVLADVNLTVVNANPNLRLNADGSVDVLGNTPAGTYVLTYQICEKAYPSNCQTATVTVTVVPPVIVATNDDYSNQPIDSSKGTVLDILANDRLNNGTVSAPQVVITIVDANGIAGVTVDAQGKVTIPTGTPVGTYVITYRICDVVNPNNCATATITIVVKDPCDFDDSASSCDILVHNAFSPNNDGRNEVFLIERIENYPDNTVEIYNRWGVLVFEVSGYDNASKVFVGLSEGRVTVNKADALPNGTYYYVVKYKKPISGVMNQKAGFLYLSR